MTFYIYYEFQFMFSINGHLSFISFFCYFDDLRAVVVYKSSDITSKSFISNLSHQLQCDTYHPAIKLLLEQASNNTFKFVKGKFSVADGMLSCTWHLNFFDSLLTYGKL